MCSLVVSSLYVVSRSLALPRGKVQRKDSIVEGFCVFAWPESVRERPLATEVPRGVVKCVISIAGLLLGTPVLCRRSDYGLECLSRGRF